MKQTQKYCSGCDCSKVFAKQSTNHILHLVITFFLLGIWLPIWIMVCISNATEPYRCQTCGQKG